MKPTPLASRGSPITDSDNEDDIEEDCSLAEVKESVEHVAAHFGSSQVKHLL